MMTNALPFNGKTVLITGSGRGIGRAIALRFAEQGADVIINFVRNEKPAREVFERVMSLGRRALLVRANIAKLEDIDRLFESISTEFGGLDYFISNAAIGFNRPAMAQKPNGWDGTMNVNARAFLFAAQKAAPLMEKKDGGAIVAISSPGAYRVLPEYISVGASKAALDALVRYLAVELAPLNIAVNAVSPGMVLTDALQHFSILADGDVVERARKATPAGRLVTPEDVAAVATFLCSPEASMIRGQIITVDGGFTLLTPQ
ncbi:MAG: enoyl-[acyl-carrier-protein] reductase FabL [Anaerolineaceae bacterium]|nr:enoyl-[acyl-carrier-protein] reductase FabL [Anaerolineaceae bacterium]